MLVELGYFIFIFSAVSDYIPYVRLPGIPFCPLRSGDSRLRAYFSRRLVVAYDHHISGAEYPRVKSYLVTHLQEFRNSIVGKFGFHL